MPETANGGWKLDDSDVSLAAATEFFEEENEGKTFQNHWSEQQKEIYWRAYAARTEVQERMFMHALKNLWEDQETEVIESLKTTHSDAATFNEYQANEKFAKTMKPLITAIFESGLELVEGGKEPKPAHTEGMVAKQGGLLNETALAWIAKRSLSLAKMVNGTTKEQIRELLAKSFAEGESIPQIVKRLEQYYGETYKVRARMVARTETIAASTEGSIQGYEELDVEKLQWYTALDERVCLICEPLHGNVYGIAESRGQIPAHPQCRCVWLSAE